MGILVKIRILKKVGNDQLCSHAAKIGSLFKERERNPKKEITKNEKRVSERLKERKT